jgi:DNA-binding CsgD family transcriptional regulator
VTNIVGDDSPLTVKDLDAVLRVLEDCESASSLDDFRMRTLEGLASHLEYRESGFAIASDFESCFVDESAVCQGVVERMFTQYLETLSDNVFTHPQLKQYLQNRGLLSLDQLPKPSSDQHRAYMDRFVIRAGISSKVFFHLPGQEGAEGLICVVDSTPDRFQQRDLLMVQILRRHLSNLMLLHVERPAPSPPSVPGLSPRQAEVVALIAQGLTNQQIANELYISVDTVKKHLTHALRVSGRGNRTQLALWWTSMKRS